MFVVCSRESLPHWAMFALDAQGKTIKRALGSLGFKSVQDVRIGKYVELELHGVRSVTTAKQQVERMCRKLLTNPVIERYHVEISR